MQNRSGLITLLRMSDFEGEYIYIYINIYIKVQQSRYRPAVAQGVPGSYGSQIS